MCDENDRDKLIYILSSNQEFCNEIIRLLKKQEASIKVFSCTSDFMGIPLSQAPSCLITSQEVAEYNEYSLIKTLQKNGLAIPVIIVTSDNENISSAVYAMKAGVIDIINKPIIERDFINRVKKVISQKYD